MALLLYLPIVNAYSKYVYAGGESIGIELKSDYVLVVGSYNKNNQDTFKIGDKIISVDNKRITNIEELTENIQEKSMVEVGIIRNGEFLSKNLNIKYENGIYRTGLYVKDGIMGIGTLTYIDPITNVFGCLGHEITEKMSKKIFEADDGSIFSSKVSKIVKSKPGSPGEKIAKFDSENVFGNIKKNTTSGIYGDFTYDVSSKELYEVGSPKIGKAIILTTIKENKIDKFEINIIKTSTKNSKHDILFEITDQDLIKSTNGIVQGMSGSPIIQDNKIIGAVTHVVVDNPIRGYGINIIKMLVEGEN